MSAILEKKRAAFFSIISNVALITLKFIVGILTHSVSVISEAVHSFADLLAAVIAFFSVKKSSEPADSDHQYGHGKYEDLSGFIEGFLIILAAGFIIWEAYKKIVAPEIQSIETHWGICVMLFSVVLNFFVSQNLFRVAKKTDSIALLADAEHLRTDIYTSFGVFVGLILVKFTGKPVFDPIIAIIVAMMIIKTGWELCASSLNNLLDTSLPESEIRIIEIIINKYIPEKAIKLEKFKTRKSGADRLVEFVLVVPEGMTIKEGHALCDSIESEIASNIGNCTITIHLEPCDQACPVCDLFDSALESCNK